MAGRFSGRRVLVTGAGRGLGYALARGYAREGAHVVLAGRDVGRLAEAIATLENEGLRAEALALDVADRASIRAGFKALSDDGPLDVLVHNAGVATFAPFDELDAGDADRMFATNLLGAVDVARAALPLFPRRGGAIVAIASLAVRRTFPNCSVYAASKAGLVAFMDVLREELRPRGIRCLTAIPGPVDTPIWDGMAGNFPRSRMMTADDAAAVVVEATRLDGTACVEEVVLLPQGGPL